MSEEVPERKCLSCHEPLTKENAYRQVNGNQLRSYCKECSKIISYMNKFKGISDEALTEEIGRCREKIVKYKKRILSIRECMNNR